MASNIQVDHPAMATGAAQHKTIGGQIGDLSADLDSALADDGDFGHLPYSSGFVATYNDRLSTAQQCLQALGEATQNHGLALTRNDTAFTDADNQSAQVGMKFTQRLDQGVQ